MKKKQNTSLLVGGIVIIAIAIGLMLIPSTSSKTKLTGQAFMETYTKTPGAVLVDVRTPTEYAAGHIQGAINIDFENPSFTSEIKKLDTSKKYFVYCRSGNRSGQSVASMKANGIASVYDLQGGVSGNAGVITLTTQVSSSSDEYVIDPSDMLAGSAFVQEKQESLLTDKEKAGLIQMREEEKLARDVYTTLGAIYGVATFSNIAGSEQTHTDAVKALLVQYTIADPVSADTVGVFQSKKIQQLYDTLVMQGKKSLTDALIVGATIEDLDIYDLDVFKKETSRQDILSVYNNLQKGSRNHMRAFVRSIQSQGGTYTPQYITKDAYTTIITSPQERGRI
jgi:rhodanese-related sulfurtransferase